MPLPNGAAIKAIRQAKGLKGVDLAAAVGISHGHLFNIESPRRKKASDEVLGHIARVLGVPLEAVSSHVEYVQPVAVTATAGVNEGAA
jgi:transcriptional regulator with XRE-family HTH domain